MGKAFIVFFKERCCLSIHCM